MLCTVAPRERKNLEGLLGLGVGAGGWSRLCVAPALVGHVDKAARNED